VVVADVFTLGAIDSLHADREKIVASYGNVGSAMELSATVAFLATTALVAAPVGVEATVANATRFGAGLVAKYGVGIGAHYVAEEFARPVIHEALQPLRESGSPTRLTGLGPNIPPAVLGELLAASGLSPEQLAHLSEDALVELFERVLAEGGNSACEEFFDSLYRPYSHLPDPESARPGGAWRTPEKEPYVQENMRRNEGVVMSDDPNDPYYGVPLIRPQKSMSGVTPPPNEWAVDHLDPASEGGGNYSRNAQITSREYNSSIKNNMIIPWLKKKN
jgi:hypothetical protein